MQIIRIAESDEEIEACFPVMHELRPHLAPAEFVPTVRRQMAAGYRLVFLKAGEEICAVAGYRFIDNLANTRILYVDDLVTSSRERSHGYGAKLLAWLAERAGEEGCHTLELDSGVQRFDAHRFYFANRMVISSHHFRLTLSPG